MTDSSDPRVAVVARLVVLVAARAGESAAIETALRAARDRLDRRLAGCPSTVRVAVRLTDDALAEAMGPRGGADEPTDGVIEVSLREGAAGADEALLGAVDDLAASLGDATDPARSAVLMGEAHLVIAGSDDTLVALAARRDSAITVEAMRRWWRYRHAPLICSTVDPLPTGYEQLHVDRERSARAATRAGTAVTSYDLFDSIYVPTAADFFRSVSDPEVAKRLLEDELGHVDHSSLRGALTRVL